MCDICNSDKFDVGCSYCGSLLCNMCALVCRCKDIFCATCLPGHRVVCPNCSDCSSNGEKKWDVNHKVCAECGGFCSRNTKCIACGRLVCEFCSNASCDYCKYVACKNCMHQCVKKQPSLELDEKKHIELLLLKLNALENRVKELEARIFSHEKHIADSAPPQYSKEDHLPENV